MFMPYLQYGMKLFLSYLILGGTSLLLVTWLGDVIGMAAPPPVLAQHHQTSRVGSVAKGHILIRLIPGQRHTQQRSLKKAPTSPQGTQYLAAINKKAAGIVCFAGDIPAKKVLSTGQGFSWTAPLTDQQVIVGDASLLINNPNNREAICIRVVTF